MKLTIPLFSQRDPRWKDIKLGTSTVSNIGNYGCLLTSCAMVCKYFGKDTDPLKLNEDMKKVKGFYNGSYWIWGKLSEVYPDINFDWDIFNNGNFQSIPADLTMIDKLLNEKIPVIVQVDFVPGDKVQEHWVVVKGKEDDYLINDPWTGEEYFFKAKYGDPARFIFAIRAYRGKVSYEPTIEDQLSDCKVSLKTANETLAEKSLVVNDVSARLEQQERDNKDLISQLQKAREEKEQYKRETEMLTGKVDGLQKGLDSALAEQTRLTEALAASQTGQIEQIDKWVALKLVIKKFLGK